jgi:hypothetical protein
MALFSRKKSKAKKASKEEEKKAAAEAKSAAATKPSQRGRNGKVVVPAPIASGEMMHDIPAPSQLPRHFNSLQDRPLASGRGRGYSFEEHNTTQDGKQDYFDPHLSSDSGYASPGQVSRGHSRAASTQQPQRDQNYLSVANKTTPQLTLGEELAQEPMFAGQQSVYDDAVNRTDGHDRNPSGGSGRSLKPSRSSQMLRNQTGADHLGPPPTTQSNQYQHQNGRQQRLIQQSMPMRPSSVPAQALQPRHERVVRPPPQRSLSPGPVLQHTYATRSRSVTSPNMNSPFDWDSPTSPTAQNVTPSFDQDEFAPSLNILSGLKVNKRGLILDEEGDPIGELFDGDIIDCVRQKADAYGDVMDEYGRVVGRVRTLSVRSTGTSLHRSITNSSNVGRRREASPPPPVPSLRSPASPTKPTSPRSGRGNVEAEDYMSMGPYDVQGPELPQGHVSEWTAQQQQQEPSAPRELVHESSVSRPESLPSVPESHGTAEVTLSENGSSASEEEHHATSEYRPEPVSQYMSAQEQVYAHQGTAKSVRDATVQQPQVMMNTENTLTGTAMMGQEQSVTGIHQAEESSYAQTAPSFNRSISDRGPPTGGLPPVPAVPKNFLDPKRVTYAQPPGFLTTQNRGKSTPLPAFPGRGLSAGMAGSPFANGPMPGMPGMGNRRLTTPGLGKMPVAGIASLSGQSPLGKPRNSIPLVRSPLSSHGKS